MGIRAYVCTYALRACEHTVQIRSQRTSTAMMMMMMMMMMVFFLLMQALRPSKPNVTWSFVERDERQFDRNAHIILSTAGKMNGELRWVGRDVCTYVCIHACMYVSMYQCIYVCTHACTHMLALPVPLALSAPRLLCAREGKDLTLSWLHIHAYRHLSTVWHLVPVGRLSTRMTS